MNLDIEVLRALVAVADERSFAAAGKKLGITQSAITQQMRRLEQSFGLPLFQKQGRNKNLNAEGKHLLGYARQLLLLHDEAIHLFDERTETPRILKIGIPDGAVNTILPRLLRYLQQNLPSVMVELHSARSPVLMDEVRKGNLDLAISYCQNPSLKSLPLYSSPTVWLCSASFSLPPNEPLPLVLSDENSIFHKLALEHLHAHRIVWQQTFMSPHPTGILSALRAGLGITARNVEWLNSDLRQVGQAEGLPELPSINYYLLSRMQDLSPLAEQAVQLFENLLEQGHSFVLQGIHETPDPSLDTDERHPLLPRPLPRPNASRLHQPGRY